MRRGNGCTEGDVQREEVARGGGLSGWKVVVEFWAILIGCARIWRGRQVEKFREEFLMGY